MTNRIKGRALISNRGVVAPFLPSIAGLYRASDLTGLVNSDPVGTWPDTSGYNIHLTQATAANKPLYKTAVLNGRPVVRFDGSNDVLTSAAISPTVTQPFTIFGVVKFNVNATALQGAMPWLMLDPNVLLGDDGLTAQFFIASSSSILVRSVSAHNTAWQIWTATFTLTAATFYLNGVQKASAVSGTNGETVRRIGGNPASPLFANMDIAEWAIYNSVPATAYLNMMGNYLATKYALSWTNIP